MNDIIKSALEITGIGIVGVFVFMLIFYAVILLLQKYLPDKEQ